jgi:Protein of unknown function (DUF2829)
MTFSGALQLIKEGKQVARQGWNGKGMFLYLLKDQDLQRGLKYGYGEYSGEPTFVSCIVMKTAQNTLAVGWVPSTADLFADDWEVVE